MDEILLRYRRRINRIDRRVAKLLARRYREVLLIGGLKRGEHRDVVDPDRESEVLKKVARLAREEEQKEYICSIYRAIFKESSSIQRGEV